MEKITDEMIIKMFFGEGTRLNCNLTRDSWMDKHEDIKNYILGRYDDSLSIQETLYRLKYGVDIRPVCPICGGEVKFEPNRMKKRGTLFTVYCSLDCANKSDERSSKIRSTRTEIFRNKKESRVNSNDDFFLNIDITRDEALKEFESFRKRTGNLLESPNKNKCILLFQQDNFYKREKYLFSTDEKIRNFIINNRVKYLNKNEEELTDFELLRGFKISGTFQGYSHFSPLWTKYFAEQNNVKCVADPFGGWGHHLVGFAAYGCKVYYNDLSEHTVDGVREISDFISANCVITDSDAKYWNIPDECDAVFMCPPYYNLEEYECGVFKSRDEYDDLINSVIDNVISSKASALGVIIREDFEYLLERLNDNLVSKEIVNPSKSHFCKKGKLNEYLYTYKLK